MTNIKKIATAIATAAVLMNGLTPIAFADTTVVVSGNGDSSTSGVSATNNNTTTVNQTNEANIENNINSTADSGGNNGNRNTGGSTSINTGNANSSVSVTNATNLNQASVQNCNCNQNLGIGVEGNGVDSTSNVGVANNNTTTLNQANNTQLTNDVKSDASSGKNNGNDNTGGYTAIETGNATSNVDVKNQDNVNTAQVGSSNGSNGGSNTNKGGSTTVLVEGNGDSSTQNVGVANNNSVTLNQANESAILNDISAKAKSGLNNANDNTGGDVLISTGNAKTNVDVQNMPNFNVASLDNCGCAADTLLKVIGNGVQSTSSISDANNNVVTDGSANSSNLTNDLTPEAKSGKNNASDNTGAVYGIDPVQVFTGDATNMTSVSNQGNVNDLGPSTTLTLPFGDVQVTNNFNDMWQQWMAFWSAHNM